MTSIDSREIYNTQTRLTSLTTSPVSLHSRPQLVTDLTKNTLYDKTSTCTLCSEKTPTHIFFHISMSDA